MVLIQRFAVTLSLGAMLSLAIAGCGKAGTSPDTAPPQEPASSEAKSGHDHDHSHDNHDHGETGPHGGALIELGGEAYHAELVHDEDGGTVTIYILDGSAKKVVPIEAKEITINAKSSEGPKQFVLTASPEEGEGERASRFVSSDAELGEALDREGADPRLVVMIEGKSYTGRVVHSH